MEKVFKSYFSRSLWSRCSKFCSDVELLVRGIKPSLLVDCLPPNIKIMDNFLKEVLDLVSSQINHRQPLWICLLELDQQDLVIINVLPFLQLFKRLKTPLLIDISEIGTPKLINDKDGTLEPYNNSMVSVFEDLQAKLKCSGLNIEYPNPFYPLSSLKSAITLSSSTSELSEDCPNCHHLPSCKSVSPGYHSLPDDSSLPNDAPLPDRCLLQDESTLTSISSQVISLSSTVSQSLPLINSASSYSSSINQCTLFGCWLQYPAVYWFHNDSGYHLDMENLMQYVVTSELDGEKYCQKHPHVLYSFTVPECLLQEKIEGEGTITLEEFISEWFSIQCLHARRNCCKFSLEKKSVTLTSVVL